MNRTLALSTAALILLSGCKSNKSTNSAADNSSRPNSAPVQTVPDSAKGNITGTVHFNGKAPAPIKIDMSQDPACSFGPTNMTEQYVVKDGKLANVFVYIKNAPNVPVEQSMLTPVVVDQKGCRFAPHVVAIVKGGAVEFRNNDSTMHNVHSMPVQVGNHTTDVSQGPGGKPENVRFNEAETMIPIRCNNHPWMNGFVNVSATPFFAVTDDKGSFNISGVPQGSYIMVFVHEKLGTVEVPVTVKAGSTVDTTAAFNMK